jgi:hypothetical protein
MNLTRMSHCSNPSSAGILEQSMGARNREGYGCRTGPPGYIGWRAGTTTRFLLNSFGPAWIVLKFQQGLGVTLSRDTNLASFE